MILDIFDMGPALLAVLVAAGVGVGVLSGLLGIGGGVIAVPVLLEVFAAARLDAAVQAPLAIGTAHALVLVASVSAALAHARAGRVDGALLRAWLPGVVAGALAGLALAAVVPSVVLVAIFALVAVLLGAAMLAGGGVRLGRRLPQGAGAHLPPALVGMFAAALGIGGGTLSGPVLALFSVPLHGAIGAGGVFNLVVALPAAAAFVLAGIEVAGRPAASLGYVALVPLALLAVPAMLVAPAAARLAPRVPVAMLRRLFGVCMLAIAARLVLRLAGV
jgi:uncharacterized membrane protein YfcA